MTRLAGICVLAIQVLAAADRYDVSGSIGFHAKASISLFGVASPFTASILSDENGRGWTVMAVDRPTRRFAVAQARRQLDAAAAAYEQLYATTS